MRRSMSPVGRQPGFTLIELLAAIAVAAMVLAVTFPAWARLRRAGSLRVATQELRGIFHFARSRAIARGASVGVRFRRKGGEWQYGIYDDGDGDGLRSDDISSGIDPLVRGEREVLRSLQGAARIAMPAVPLPDPDGGRQPLDPSSSPVRFGRTTICSFTRNGSATPGSIFLSWGDDSAAMVRVYGATAKIRAIRYLPQKRRWEP